MVRGFGKLEKFFGNPKKKGRGPDTKENFSFPAPSFMRPTSIHMAPREEHVPFTRVVIDQRSYSLPHQQDGSQSRSSAESNITMVDPRHRSSVPARSNSLAIRRDKNTSRAQRLSRYRSPEDSLSRIDSTVVYTQRASKHGAVEEYRAEELQEDGFLDWSPKHISSLFNALDLELSFQGYQAVPQDDTAESVTLIPSLPSSASISPATKIGSTVTSSHPSPKSDVAPTRRLSLFPRQYPLPPLPRPHLDSPPPSDSEEECHRAVIDRSRALIALTSRVSLTPRSSFESKYQRELTKFERKKSFRESWGTRPGDPNGLGSAIEHYNDVPQVPQSHPVRKSTSADTLSTVIKEISRECDLKEPTIEEFWALTDDDVAEPLYTPTPDLTSPPTPPPKDIPKPTTPRNSIQKFPAKPFPLTTAINPSSGELTPPFTPTNSQFLALAYSPSTPSGALGAMWAAAIAKNFNFDLVYVVSLWPTSEGSSLDLSRPSALRDRHRRRRASHNTMESGYDTAATPKAGGRLLAAYGLSEFPSPFEIHTKFHVSLLKFRGWKEYRDEDATPGTISRGWACSFYSDSVPTSRTGVGTEYNTQGGIMNRGVIFAAYTKQASSSTIPLNPSPDQEAILENLYGDAKNFVNALVHGA
ncbi:hypothetical protein F5B20DRAFT_480025 [Whalleya microplaca]|nr:hypothetical protein F5B20DRAFT_480025 [Whalleya microplaca]